jgi:hypothetical protein
MIVGIGMCMLIVGLIGIVILQIFRKRLLEGFVYNDGAGCVEDNCKLTNLDKKITAGTITDADYALYAEWCINCTNTKGNCVWDSDKRECNVKSGYVPPDPTTPDAIADPCSVGCTNIEGEGACNRCPSCISCVKVDPSNPGSDNRCIDRKDYTPELCPGTDETKRNPNSSSSSDDDYKPSSSSSDDDYRPSSSNNDETPDEREARHRRERDAIDSGDTMDYTTEESAESAKAKEKNSESKFLRDFQSIVHNELLNEQGMTTANSQEYLRDKARRRRENMRPNQKCGCPDMSEYVRKDSIPCWGCTLE